ncbi:penicillin-binding protein [Campylobacterota bacterium]|nr:penicillin-binding protein [Campylobacterota bacterium]
MENTGKIVAIYLFILLFAIVFIIGAIGALRGSDYDRDYFKTEAVPAFRGSIVSSDWRTLSLSERRFSVAFDGRDAENRPLIAKLVALFAFRSEAEITDLLNREARVILAKDLSVSDAKNLRQLSAELDRRGAFKPVLVQGAFIRRGLEVIEQQPHTRLYEYGSLLQPVLGYMHKFNGTGQMGLERFYEAKLKAVKEGSFKAPRDAGGNLIYNSQMRHTPAQNGLSLQLSVNAFLQYDLERTLDAARAEMDASEIICAVMESSSGSLLALATSARYDAGSITNETIVNMRMNAAQYPFEPGSVMKPFIVAILFDENLAGQYDLVRGYGGRFKIGSETINDLERREWFSVEDVVVYSSNIGAAQLAMRLSPYQLFDGLSAFGFAKPSGIDLPYEATGDLPGLHKLRGDIYRATAGYGYGLRVTFIQLLKAYNVFNNGGVMVAPRLVEQFIGANAPAIEAAEQTRVISEASAMKIIQILRKTIVRGNAAVIDGIFTAGKTGTAHIARGGSYINDYHNTFFGFANGGDQKYTIGVLVIDPKKHHYASRTAAPIFLRVTNLLIKHNLLEK